MRYLLMLVVLFLATGCQITGANSPPVLMTAAGPAPEQPADKARVYLYRETAGVRSMWFTPVFELNDTRLYEISSSTLYVFDVAPCDPCSFYLKSPSASQASRINTSGFHKLPLKAGEKIYLRISHSVSDTLSPGTKALSMVLSGDPADKLLYNLTVPTDVQAAMIEANTITAIRYTKVE